MNYNDHFNAFLQRSRLPRLSPHLLKLQQFIQDGRGKHFVSGIAVFNQIIISVNELPLECAALQAHAGP
jgi:hypothetical protein